MSKDRRMRSKRHLAQNLAASLARSPWSPPELSRCLHRRLPPALTPHIPALVDDLSQSTRAPYAPRQSRITETLLAAPSFVPIHSYCLKHNTFPAPDLTEPIMLPQPAFADLPIPPLPTPGALADWLNISPARLAYLADPNSRHEAHGDMAVNHYHYHLHPKAHGGHRLVEAPKHALKTCQRAILRHILNPIPVHPSVFGFVKSRNCQQGANRHASEAMVLCFDVKNFFPSIPSPRIFALLRRLGYPEAVARLLTSLSTTRTPSRILTRLPAPEREAYNKPHLPQGAPTSPALANLTLHALDHRLAGLARSLETNYSRYADDITFSGDRSITAPLLRYVPEILRSESLTLNQSKTRIMSASTSQRVTGIQVNRLLNIPRKTFDQIKATIHASARDGRLRDAGFRAHLLARINWVASLNPNRAAKLTALLERALSK